MYSPSDPLYTGNEVRRLSRNDQKIRRLSPWSGSRRAYDGVAAAERCVAGYCAQGTELHIRIIQVTEKMSITLYPARLMLYGLQAV